jgi:hypothetical protein
LSESLIVERLILDHKCQKSYNYKQHIKYATQSSGSPITLSITLELQLFITLYLCSGAMYLDIIWYGVSLKSISEIFWPIFPDTVGVMKLVKDWSKEHKDHHGFSTNMGTALALDVFVIEIQKPNASDLDGQEVGCFRNHKGFWGLISHIACDPNAIE